MRRYCNCLIFVFGIFVEVGDDTQTQRRPYAFRIAYTSAFRGTRILLGDVAPQNGVWNAPFTDTISANVAAALREFTYDGDRYVNGRTTSRTSLRYFNFVAQKPMRLCEKNITIYDSKY